MATRIAASVQCSEQHVSLRLFSRSWRIDDELCLALASSGASALSGLCSVQRSYHGDRFASTSRHE